MRAHFSNILKHEVKTTHMRLCPRKKKLVYEPTDLINLGGGGVVAANSHFIAIDKLELPSRVRQFRKVNERCLEKRGKGQLLGGTTYPWLPKDCMKNI